MCACACVGGRVKCRILVSGLGEGCGEERNGRVKAKKKQQRTSELGATERAAKAVGLGWGGSEKKKQVM